MDPQRHARIKQLFAEARELEPGQRAGFLDDACRADVDLRREVEELLSCDDPAGGSPLDAALRSRDLAAEGAAGETRLLPEGPGTRIGPYRIVSVLGEGGFGTVYRAEQSQPVRREVALKVIKLGMDTRRVVARFEAERQALALMDHPSIARVYDAGATAEGRPYFVMELVEGEPISAFCDREQLSVRARLVLFRQVCLAVQHAHQRGILHRDIKPSNVLVTRVDGEPLPKVIDFGIAKATERPLTDSSLATEAFQVIGTPEYMPPEQASGQDVDTRADVYALGVVLYELLTGKRPFGASDTRLVNLGDLLQQIHEVTPPKPSTRASGLGAELDEVARSHGTNAATFTRSLRGDLDWIVMKALEKDRERRYVTAIDLADDVANHLAHRPVNAGRPSALYRLRKMARRNRPLFAAGSVVVVTLLAGIGALVWGFVVVRAERDAADRARLEEAAARAEAVRSQRQEAAARTRADEAAAAAEVARVNEAGERARAEEALEEARQVVEFLATSLAAARPEEMGRDVTMRAVLDQAARRIEGRLHDRPRVEARLRFVMGSSYQSLGVLPEAARHLELAADLYAEVDGERAPTTFDTRRELAMVYTDQNRPSDALPLLESLLAQASELEGQALVELLDVQNAIAVLLLEAWQVEPAERIWEEQVRIADEAPGLEEERMIALGNLAMLYEQTSRPEEALELYGDVLAYYAENLGPEHPETLNKLNNMALAVMETGRFDEAEARMVELIDIRTRVLGEEHPDTLGTIYNLAQIYERSGRLEEAEALLLQVSEAEERVLGEAHRWTFSTRNMLGAVYRKQGRLAEAEALLRDVAERASRHLGPEDPGTLNPLQNLADVLVARGQGEEGLRLYQDILPVRVRLQGEVERNVLGLQLSLAGLLVQLGRAEEAAGVLERAIEVRATAVGDVPDIAEARRGLAAAYLELGRLQEAEAQYRRAHAHDAAVFGESSWYTLRDAMGLARALARQGRAEDERAAIERTVGRVRKAADSPFASPRELADYANFLLECEPTDLRGPGRALGLAQRAVEVAGRESLPLLLTLARALREAGEREQAGDVARELLGQLQSGEPLRAYYVHSLGDLGG